MCKTTLMASLHEFNFTEQTRGYREFSTKPQSAFHIMVNTLYVVTSIFLNLLLKFKMFFTGVVFFRLNYFFSRLSIFSKSPPSSFTFVWIQVGTEGPCQQ